MATFSWKESGIGAPLATHADFERVGGHCADSEIVTGISFKRAGCHVHTSWDHNGLSSSSLPACTNERHTDRFEGLVVVLNCGEGLLITSQWRCAIVHALTTLTLLLLHSANTSRCSASTTASGHASC
jgi:hypothetical protein